jgi:hypothetical protein
LQREALHALCADCIGDDQGAKFNTLLGLQPTAPQAQTALRS